MFAKQLIIGLLKLWSHGSFAIRFWDGDIVNFGKEKPVFTVIFTKKPDWAIKNTDIVTILGESYAKGFLSIEGSLDEVIRVVQANNKRWTEHPQLSPFRTDSVKGTSTKTERHNIHSHYDLGNDFFSQWLDPTMSYSCAYFEHPSDTLEQAQMNKIHHSLKKLQLQPGMSLLDIGCGWGYLAVEAAKLYDVNVTGITLSEEQYAHATELAHKQGVADKVTILLKGYQELDPSEYQFDRIDSIGMFEHVGKPNLPVYMNTVNRLLKDDGISLLHSIIGTHEGTGNSWIGTYIFPGGYIPSLRETISLLPDFDFHLLHCESLRLHYAKTLDLWDENYREHWAEISEKHGEEFARMWDLYLRGCAAAFRTSGLDLYQFLFTKGLNNQLPITYSYIYN